MQKPAYDPAFLHARREAVVILLAYAATITYTLTYCFTHDLPAEAIKTWYGVPEWVLWGVFLPWGVCVVFTGWFCFFYMKEDALDPPAPPAPAAFPPSVDEPSTENS